MEPQGVMPFSRTGTTTTTITGLGRLHRGSIETTRVSKKAFVPLEFLQARDDVEKTFVPLSFLQAKEMTSKRLVFLSSSHKQETKRQDDNPNTHTAGVMLSFLYIISVESYGPKEANASHVWTCTFYCWLRVYRSLSLP